MWWREHARIHQRERMPISSHKINLGTILLDAMEESEVTENVSFGGFTCPTAAMFVTQGRPRIGHFLVAQLPLCGTAQQTGTLLCWLGSKHHHEILRQCLGLILPGFRIPAAWGPQALSWRSSCLTPAKSMHLGPLHHLKYL